MEEKQLNLDAPFLSVRRISTKPKNPSESDHTKNKKTTKTKTKKVKDSCQETEHETPVRLLQEQSFDHVMEPSSVPFKWEQIPGKPNDLHTLIEESDLIKALAMVSTASFSVNCSTKGVSDELEKNEAKSSSVWKDDVILEYRDLIMSKFLPNVKAMALKQKKVSPLDQEKKKNQSIFLHRVYSNVSKKALFGLCSKNSLDVLNPVLSRVKTCQDLGVKPGKILNPKSQDSVYKTKSASPRILRSKYRVRSKSQELYPIPRLSTEVSKISLSDSSGTVRIPRNPSRLQRTRSDQIQRQDIRFLVEEVKRRSQRNKIRSRSLSVSQPPLPKTPSESWLCRTLPRSSAASVVSGSKKMDQKSIKWETIVKTSYKHHDHVRYIEELNVVNTNPKPESSCLQIGISFSGTVKS